MENTVAHSKIAMVIRVTSGNFLEMYDFFLFGLYAPVIARSFFPSGSDLAGLLLTFSVFGAGFLMRPLGAIVLGGYVDRVGRRKGLLVTLSLMAAGTVLIAAVPGYATIGVAAPVLVLAGRLLQGFSAGCEQGGVSVYLSEIATPRHRGFYVAWQSSTAQASIMAAALSGFVLNSLLSPAELTAWGWRIPFLLGCAIVPLLFLLRRSLQETEAFLQRQHHPALREVTASLLQNWRIVGLGVLLVATTTLQFYTITIYTPTFGKAVLHLSDGQGLAITFCVALANLILVPAAGALSDLVGRKSVLLAFSALTVLTAYPVMAWLVAHPSFGNMLGALLWLSVIYSGYTGAMIVALIEVVPPAVRTSGFSLAYTLATALFGGFTPLVSTWLIQLTGDRAAVGLWMTMGGALGFAATLCLYRKASMRSEKSRVIAAPSLGS